MHMHAYKCKAAVKWKVKTAVVSLCRISRISDLQSGIARASIPAKNHYRLLAQIRVKA